MNVAGILAQKGRDVATISADAAVGDVVKRLATQKIGALVVVDDRNRVIGIVSERDIVRSLDRNGAAAVDEAVSEIMTRGVVACQESETINEVMGRMTLGRFRHLPVIEDDRLVGIVSIGDVVKARIEEVESEAEEMRAYIATA